MQAWDPVFVDVIELLRRNHAEGCGPVPLHCGSRSKKAKACGNYCRALTAEH